MSSATAARFGRSNARAKSTGLARRSVARADQREPTSELDRELAVGADHVADHQQVARPSPTSRRTASAIGRNGLPAISGSAARRRRHRRHDRPASGHRPRRGRVQRVGVRGHEPGAGPHGRGRQREPVVVELAMQTDDDRVDTGADPASSSPAPEPRRPLSTASTIPGPPHTSTRSPAFTSVAAAIGDDTTSPGAVDADRRQRGLVLGEARPRRVRHEQHPVSGTPQSGNGFDRPGDRHATEPDHAVEVTQHGRRLAHGRGTYRVVVATLSAVPRFEPFRALRYATSELDDLIAPPYDVLSADDVAALGARSDHNIVHVDVPAARPGSPVTTATQRGDDPAVVDRCRRDGARRRGGVHDLPHALHRRDGHRPRPRRRARRAGGRRRRAPAACSPTSARRRRPRPTASTSRGRRRPNLSPVWGLSLAPGLTDVLREPAEVVGARHRRRRDPHRRTGHRPRRVWPRSATTSHRTTC